MEDVAVSYAWSGVDEPSEFGDGQAYAEMEHVSFEGAVKCAEPSDDYRHM